MLSPKPWRVDAVFIFIAAQIACFLLGATLAAMLHKIGLPGFKETAGFGNIFLETVSFQGAACVLMFIFFRLHHVDWRDVFGFGKKRLLRSLLLALGLIIFILPIAALLQEVSVALMERLHWTPQNEPAVELITEASTLSKVYLGFFAVVLAPVAEEFIFRGMLFPIIKQHGFPKIAWIGVSLFFALIHVTPGDFIPLFVLALALTWLYEVTDSLIAPIFAHALFNAANLLIFFKFQS